MATKLICDRCGAEINPKSSVTYAGMRKRKNDINDNDVIAAVVAAHDYELCVSCAHELREWLNCERSNAQPVSYTRADQGA